MNNSSVLLKGCVYKRGKKFIYYLQVTVFVACIQVIKCNMVVQRLDRFRFRVVWIYSKLHVHFALRVGYNRNSYISLNSNSVFGHRMKIVSRLLYQEIVFKGYFVWLLIKLTFSYQSHYISPMFTNDAEYLHNELHIWSIPTYV